MTVAAGGGRGGVHKMMQSCPKSASVGDVMFEKLLQLILPLACAVALWVLVALPWGGAA